MMSYMGAVGLATPLVLLWFPRAIRTMGGTRFVRAGVALAFVGNLIRLIAPAHIPLLVFGQLLSNTGLLVFTMMQGFFLLQVVSHSAQKTKIRMEGLTAAVSGLCGKIGAGLASVLMGGLMGLAGYSAAAHEQAPSAISMIIALFTWVPAILCALLYVTLCFYDLDRK
jgi:GPH family glycoside/pentoside/hexuronide:cation symporter